MPLLKITSKGQVTLKKEILQHLGVRAGDSVEIELKPDHNIGLRPIRTTKTLADLAGMLQGEGNGRKVTIEEMNEAIAEGWAGRR